MTTLFRVFEQVLGRCRAPSGSPAAPRRVDHTSGKSLFDRKSVGVDRKSASGHTETRVSHMPAGISC